VYVFVLEIVFQNAFVVQKPILLVGGEKTDSRREKLLKSHVVIIRIQRSQQTVDGCLEGFCSKWFGDKDCGPGSKDLGGGFVIRTG
jgi:hypothetical protein